MCTSTLNIFNILFILIISCLIFKFFIGESIRKPNKIKNDPQCVTNAYVNPKTEVFCNFPNIDCSTHHFYDCNTTDIIDTFMYNGENNLLGLRLKIMKVKFRFIFICNYSFLGMDKSNYINHIPQNMIIMCDDSCRTNLTIFKDGAFFDIEQCLRNQFRDKVLKKIKKEDNFRDFSFIMNDLDEYVNPCDLNGTFSQSILTKMYRYNINNYVNYGHKSMYLNFSDYESLDHHELRLRGYLNFPIIKPSSAFQCSSCFDNILTYQNKIRTFAHGDPNFMAKQIDFDKERFTSNTCTQLIFEG